jgi:hypothetical protein
MSCGDNKDLSVQELRSIAIDEGDCRPIPYAKSP